MRWGLPFVPFAGYGASYSDDYLPPPVSVIVIMPPQVEAPSGPPPPPPPPARPEMKEYTWPNSSNDSSDTFAIVLKNGTVKRALAYCIQDEDLSYVTPQGTGERIQLEAVDREATREANPSIFRTEAGPLGRN